MPERILLVYLDDNHLADSLFLQGLTRELRTADRSHPKIVLVHGSGEQAERRLEGEGLFRKRENGVLQVESQEEARLVDQVTRTTNRKLVGLLTDAVIPAVGIQGDDRNLLQLNEHQELYARSPAWVEGLLDQGAVLIVSALAAHAAVRGTREVSGHEALIALGRHFGPDRTRAVFFLRRNQAALLEEGKRLAEIKVSALPGDEKLPAPYAVDAVVKAGLEVILTNPAGLFGDSAEHGTRVLP